MKPKAYAIPAISICMVFALSCKDNANNVPTPVPECNVSLNYDAETTTVFEAAQIADTSQLTLTDRCMMLPRNERVLESICLKSDGKFTITSEYIDPVHPIVYPEGTIGRPRQRKYKKVVNDNGTLTYYNAQNEVIDNDVTLYGPDTDIQALIATFTSLKSQPALDSVDFNHALSLMASSGLSMTQFPNGIVATRTNLGSAGYSISLIDKQAHMQIGQLNFDTNGTLQHLYMLKVSGVAPNVVFQRMIKVDFFKAFESGVRTKRTEFTDYKTFNLNF